MRRCRFAFEPAAILAGEIALSHRIRPGARAMRHEHRRGGGLRHTGRVSVPPGTIVWLSAVRSRQSWPLSRLQRAFPIPRAHSRCPRTSEWCPSTPLARAVRPLRRAPGPRSRQPADNRRVAVSHPTAAPATRSTGRDRGSKRRHAHRCDVAPASLTQSRAPSMRFLSPRWCTNFSWAGPTGALWPERRYRSELASRTPSD